MTFIANIKKLPQSIRKYWKNRTFRRDLREEKRKKYLIEPTKGSTEPLFSFFAKKKRFYYFNIVLGAFEKNKDRFRLSFFLIGSFILLLSTYILFFSPYFRISPSKVIIERLDTITDINIAYKAIEDVYGASIFSIDENDIRTKLIDLQKNIKQVEISRLFPNGLKIITESYKPEFTTQFPNNDKSYVLTSNGILIFQKEAPQKLYALDIIDPTLSESSFLDYKEGVHADVMLKIIQVREFFLKAFSNVGISKFSYFRAERELHISIESGAKIILRLGDDIEKQLATLRFYTDLNKDVLNSGDITYIDIREIGKIFVCKEKAACMKNLIRIYGPYYEK